MLCRLSAFGDRHAPWRFINVPIHGNDTGGAFINNGESKAAAHQVVRERYADVVHLSDLEVVQVYAIDTAGHLARNSNPHLLLGTLSM